MVRSTNTHGDAIGIVGTVLEPYDADPAKVVVYSYTEDSASPDCAPSYSILYEASPDTAALQLESLFSNVLLTKGWYVVIPDYEGPNAAFLAGRLGGLATLDSIKGVLKSGNETNIDPNAQVALWGFSGGTLPTTWAAVLQPSYAPELSKNLVGAAFGGWVSNITRTIQYLDGGLFSGFLASGIMGIVTEYPEIEAKLWDHVNPSKKSQLLAAKSSCLIQTLLSHPLTRFFGGPDSYFPKGYSLFNKPAVHAMLQDNILTANKSVGVPQIPLFAYHGKPDEIVPFENSVEGFNTFCQWGVKSFEFSTSKKSGHVLEYIEGAGAALKWIGDRFDGKAPAAGCQRTDRVSNLDYPGVDTEYYQIISMNEHALSYDPLGPDLDSNKTLSGVEKWLYQLVRNAVDNFGPIPLKRDLMADAQRLAEFF